MKSSITTTNQHRTRSLFDQKLGVKCKEETIKVLHLGHSFVWCGNLDSSESRSELLRTFWNVVLQKDRGDQLDWSFEKWRSITKNRREQEHPTTMKQKKLKCTRHQFMTLTNKMYRFFYIFMLQYQTEYWYMFRSTRGHCQENNSKQYRITLLLYATDKL